MVNRHRAEVVSVQRAPTVPLAERGELVALDKNIEHSQERHAQGRIADVEQEHDAVFLDVLEDLIARVEPARRSGRLLEAPPATRSVRGLGRWLLSPLTAAAFLPLDTPAE
jgi:hypothetical protein